ncbi:MAG: hypothetical protein V4463_22880 [Pseudomonadota bacterium]
MTEITLALPFSLPPPELAPDLAKALKAPALAALLSRTAHSTRNTSEERELPHERWLAQALGVKGFGGSTMRALGQDPADGRWFLLHPAHIEIARSHLLLNDLRRLQLDEGHARALFDAACPYFAEIGLTLVYGNAGTWFLRADAWIDMQTASPDAAAGLNLNDWMPTGKSAVAYRRLQNEIQMLWFEHPANGEREAAGLRPVNAFWPWSPAPASDTPTLSASNVPAWLHDLAQQHPARFAQHQGGLHVCGALAAAAIAGDWGRWIAEMHQLEEHWFAPMLAALKAGTLERAHLVLAGRDSLAEFTTTRLAQRKFWRRPTLDALKP